MFNIRNPKIILFFLKKFISIKIILILLLSIFGEFNISKKAIASYDSNYFRDYIKKSSKENFYILGPGDKINMKVNESTRELDTTFSINGEGLAHLPRLKKIYVEGLTVSELTEILNEEYKTFVKIPNVELTILNHRPVKVYIDGEVENPGMHVLPGTYTVNAYFKNNLSNIPTTSSAFSSLNNDIDEKYLSITNQIISNTFFPTVTDALRTSGGVTLNADLSKIEITRNNSISNGKGKIRTSVDILKSIELKDNSQNIRILDGDTIYVSKSETQSLNQISSAIKSNINPKFINIYIAGRVENSGILKVNKYSSLNDALSLVGIKILKGPLRFLRYKNDGSIDSRKFSYKKSANRGSYKNPLLVNGDIIYISKSAWNATSEVIGEITSPFQGIISSYTIFKALQNL